MTKTLVTCDKKENGWAITTADRARNVILDGFDTEDDAKKAALELDFEVTERVPVMRVLVSNVVTNVGRLEINTEFLVGKQWYRLLRKTGGSALVHEIGTGSSYCISLGTEPDEVRS